MKLGKLLKYGLVALGAWVVLRWVLEVGGMEGFTIHPTNYVMEYPNVFYQPDTALPDTALPDTPLPDTGGGALPESRLKKIPAVLGKGCTCESQAALVSDGGVQRDCQVQCDGGPGRSSFVTSVTGDCRWNWAPDSIKGKTRVYKMPNYYGYGTGSGFHYGEPYYLRTVDY